jgi:hypothetical protein
VLNSNAALYLRPYKNGEDGNVIKGNVTPSYQYSQVGDPMDQCDIGAVVFSAFTQAGRVTPDAGQMPATGVESYSQQQQFKSGSDLVSSNERDSRDSAPFLVFWTDEQHFTTDGNGSVLPQPDASPEDQFKNPIGRLSVVLVARDRDNEVWAKQGEDMIDLTIAIQMGWTDVLTIAKHQGFSLLTVTSAEKPEKLNIGVNRAIWNKMGPDGKAASIGYVQANSPLEEYMGLLTELLGLLLSTNGVSVGSISGGKASPQNFTSGFHALVAAADSIESVEADKPIMRKAECEAWELIAAWHNWMFDNQLLSEDARAMGKFSDKFKVNIVFAEVKPLESLDEVIARIEKLMGLNLITRSGALKMLNPTLDDKGIDKLLADIDQESADRMARAKTMFGTGSSNQDGQGGANAGETGSQDQGDAADAPEGDQSAAADEGA